MVCPKEPSGFGQPFVSLLTITQLGPVGLCIDGHASELVDIKRSAEASDTLLLEDDRSVFAAFHGEITDYEKRGEDDKTHCGQEEIEPSLDLLLKSVHTIINIRVVLLHSVPFSSTSFII